ncbi:hypothetical protein [Streptomyces broussonetiae]|uniref:Type A2 lantipeptide n=1 Tax=Streptomyces broussonetiae TaxID=2686304 RepID=A0A6I6NAV8_9ACTN|nr:hypothetical protein [Streptomyces broussonetiae]QHA05476.1 hypothetical protein GQF42_21190 [Streptomyces broussonetiae]
MNSAHQVQTAEISDADLDTVSAGSSVTLGGALGGTLLGGADVTSQFDGAKGGAALGLFGQFQLSTDASL